MKGKCYWLLVILSCMSTQIMTGQVIGDRLPPWQEGYLDIHFISTGRGESAFYVLPDGTTMLVDAGELDPTDPRTQSSRNTSLFPDYTKPAHGWIVDYIRQIPISGRETAIDYALVTHYHSDHFGAYFYGAPKSKQGDYILTGISGVGEYIPIARLMDRGYNYPIDLKKLLNKLSLDENEAKTIPNYQQFIETQKQKGMQYSVFKPGRNDQIVLLRNPGKFRNFELRNVIANGEIWTGKGTQTFQHLPDYNKTPDEPFPNENAVSCGFIISYGAFRFAACADIPGVPAIGAPVWADVETAVAPVIGQVDVCTMNHHANRDAMNINYLKALQPRVMIQNVWSSDHPGHEALIRMTSRAVYPGERDLFATAMLEANMNVIGPALEKSYQSIDGHIVVRIKPGGKNYQLFVLNQRSHQREIVKICGPYTSKKQ